MAEIIDIQAASSTEPVEAHTVTNSSGSNTTTVQSKGNEDVAVGIPRFEGFSDFELDLTCLSPPSSPPMSIYSDARSCSPTSSPRHSISFQSSPPHTSPTKLSLLRLPSVTASSIVGGSLPLMSHLGRGTPIDRNRRSEWGGLGLDEVGEDGVLFSAIRSTSLDSAAPQLSRRSISPEGNLIHHKPSGRSVAGRNRRRSEPKRPTEPSTPPAVQLNDTETSREWASSFMETVLASSSNFASTSTPQSTSDDGREEEIEAKAQSVEITPAEEDVWPAQLTGTEAEAGIEGALNIGIRYRDVMDWFDHGVPPTSDGRDSPSVYSLQSQPQPPPFHNYHASSRPTSVTRLDTMSTNNGSVKRPHPAEISIEHQSNSSQAAWWRKWLRKVKKIHFLFGAH